MTSCILPIAALLWASSALMAQTPVGAFFAFQDAASQSAVNGEGVYSATVSAENFPGTPTFSGTGLLSGGLGGFTSNFTAYNASVWTGARCAGWNARTAANRTWQTTLDTTGLESLTARFNYRLNNAANGGVPVNALAAFEYRIGSGPWLLVPGASLALVNNTGYNNQWTANLSALTALNNQPEITLRWSFPAFDPTPEDEFVRLDNLQITGTLNSSSLVWTAPAQLPQGRVGVAYSGNVAVTGGGTAPYSYQIKAGSFLPGGLSLTSGGSITGTPTSAGNYPFIITAADSSQPPKTADRQFSLAITRARALPQGNYNVLFIAFDDLKANFGPFLTPEHAAAMPKPVTPHLDHLSSTGMAFTRAYCQQAVCWASRASLLTGCRPDTTKVWDDGPNLRDTMPGIITLPQHFADRGYNVAGYGKIYDPRSIPANQDAALARPDGQADRGASRTYFEQGKWQVERDTGSSNGFATDMAVTNFWVTPNRLSLIYPLVGARTDVTSSAKTSTTLSNWTTTGVINETISQDANRTWRRSKTPAGGAAPAKRFLRLEFER